MARCRSTPSAARAIGVFISTHKVLTMTTNKRGNPAASSGTMEESKSIGSQAAAARAQTELIELLARLVLAGIEAEAVVAAATRECGADERRTRRPGN
jgi:UDP-N-acetylglucosamine 2-epimerase